MLQKQVLEVGGERVRRAKARCDRASEAVEDVVKLEAKLKADSKAVRCLDSPSLGQLP